MPQRVGDAFFDDAHHQEALSGCKAEPCGLVQGADVGIHLQPCCDRGRHPANQSADRRQEADLDLIGIQEATYGAHILFADRVEFAAHGTQRFHLL